MKLNNQQKRRAVAIVARAIEELVLYRNKRSFTHDQLVKEAMACRKVHGYGERLCPKEAVEWAINQPPKAMCSDVRVTVTTQYL
jgi:hypothetical protein